MKARRKLVPTTIINANLFAVTILLLFICLTYQFLLLEDKPLFVKILFLLLMFLSAWGNLYDSVLYINYLLFKRKGHAIEFPLPETYPAVAFLIYSCNEPFEVAKMTFDSARDIDYAGKKEIIVVDNTKDTTSKDFVLWKKYVESYGSNNKHGNIESKFVYNEKRDGLKPGNMDESLKHIVESEFVVFLDVDSTLPLKEKLIERSIAQFNQDCQLGYIQFQIISKNDYFNSLTAAIAVTQNMLRIRRDASAYGGFCFFLGHNSIWRKTVLDKIGPWLGYYRGNIVVTEDMYKTIAVYENDYYGKTIVAKTGEWTPCSLDGLENMWLRWTYGTAQVICKHFKEIFSTKHFLFSEKIDQIQHFLTFFANTVVYPISVIMLIALTPANLNLTLLVIYFIPAFLRMIVSYQFYLKNSKMPFVRKLWNLYAGFFIVDSFIFITSIKAVINFILRKPQGWKITPKNVEGVPSWKSVIMNRRGTLLFSCSILAIILIKWIFAFNCNLAALISYFPAMLMYFNVLICVLLYGKEGRKGSEVAIGA